MTQSEFKDSSYRQLLDKFENYESYKIIFENRVLDGKLWKKAKNANNKIAYTDYLSQYPNGLYKKEANLKIESLNAQDHQLWGVAIQKDTENSYKTYLEEQPEGLYKAEAESRYKQLKEKRIAGEQERAKIAREEAERKEQARLKRMAEEKARREAEEKLRLEREEKERREKEKRLAEEKAIEYLVSIRHGYLETLANFPNLNAELSSVINCKNPNAISDFCQIVCSTLEYLSKLDDLVNFVINSGVPFKEAYGLISPKSFASMPAIFEQLTIDMQNLPSKGCDIWRKVNATGEYLPPWASNWVTKAVEDRISKRWWVPLPNTYTHFNNFANGDVSDAIRKINELNHASISYWRLPTLAEIQQFAAYSHKSSFGLPSEGRFWIVCANTTGLVSFVDIQSGFRSITGGIDRCRMLLVSDHLI